VLSLTPKQRILSDIFSEVLGLEKIDIHDDFFKLGGHSLTAAKVIYRVQSRLNTELPVPVLYQKPTIAELAQLIEENSQQHNTHSSVDSIPLTAHPHALT